jgi:hypothetical protein
MTDDLFGPHVRNTDVPLATRIPRMPNVNFLSGFFACEDDLIGIDHDYGGSEVPLGCKVGPVLSP